MKTMCALLCAGSIALCADADTGRTESPAGGLSEFTYEILPPEPGASDITAQGDSVRFQLFYVDSDCGDGYEYRCEKRRQSLVVSRVPPGDGQCAGDQDALYGVKGVIRGVAPGTYAFELETQNSSGAAQTVFREVIQVR